MTTTETVFVHPADQAEQRGSHYIEDSLSVYVMRDLGGTDKWVLDPSTFGESLYTSYEKPETGNCQCGKPEECEAAALRMGMASTPDAEELMHMLADHLGYTLTKN